VKIQDNIEKTFKDKEFGYAEKNRKSPWWWPLLLNVDGVDDSIDYNNLESVY
tara:strand:+ start:901 stop:1056 length:156 start_codon:yes stop_codon:yes gene_type:complete